MTPTRACARWLRFAALLLLALLFRPAWSAPYEGDLTLQGGYWFDESGSATVQQVSDGLAKPRTLDRPQSFKLGTGALWIRFDLPALDGAHRWYLMLTGPGYTNRAMLYTRSADGTWREQRSGDHVRVMDWDHPNFVPLFSVPAERPGAVWLRLENSPGPVNPFIQLLTDESLQFKRQWTYLLIGGYLGFGLLVFIVGLIHARLYGDRVFDVYCIYVAAMLLFQLAYTGVGGLLIWPHWAWLNDAAPPTFMLIMVGSGIWFIREATSLSRHGARIDRFVLAFSAFGPVFAPLYLLLSGPLVYSLLQLYALASVIISITLCLWTWRRGERYSWWLFLGFLPVHLGYPFPALRAAGLLPDSWATQYAVLIGSALEIPLLLYILNWRAKDFSENRVRLRAIDTTDPLTGLPIIPVLRLRVRDALRRARRAHHRCTVLLVELANYDDIVRAEGRDAGDRALVVAGSRLSGVVREVDTVCRVADARFALLLEGPQSEPARRTCAQHIVARGLEPVSQLPQHLSLKFRIVTAWVPEPMDEAPAGGQPEELQLLETMDAALNRILEDERRVVLHLEDAKPAPQPTEPAPA